MMKPHPPNSHIPWRCVICAIDPGKTSGVSIYCKGELQHSDYLRGKDVVEGEYTQEWWTGGSYAHANGLGIPLIFVIEQHNHHGKWGDKQFAGTAESIGVWKHYIKQLPRIKRWTPKVLMLPVDEWRKGIYGQNRAPRNFYNKKTRKMTTDPNYWKEAALRRTKVDDHNEAESILIGEYATKWWKVGDQSGVKPIGG